MRWKSRTRSKKGRTMRYRAPETFETGGGNWLSVPGTYHAVVTHTDEQPVDAKGGLLDGFRITFQALEGTVRDDEGRFTERDKTIDLLFWNPKLTDKNEGLFNRQKQGKFLIAVGLLKEDQVGTDVDIDLEDAVGRQVVFTLHEEDDGKSERKFLKLHFSDIWHIDDPAAAKFPQCAASKKLIPAPHRRDPKSFEKTNGTPPSKTKPSGKAKDVDLDDL